MQHGLANEMRAAAWLIDEGYEVFIVAMKEGNMVRVEVKGLGRPNGMGRYWVQVNREMYDMLLVVTPEGAVVADPPEALVGRGRGKRTLRANRHQNGRSRRE